MEFSVLMNKMLIFVAIMLIGYYFGKKGIAGPEFTKIASRLVLNVFMVGTILYSMITTGAERDLSSLAEILLLTSVMQVLGFVISAIIMRFLKIDSKQAGCYEVLMALGNSMFIALPIAEAVYGSYAVFIVSVSCIPFNVILYSYGIWRIRGGSLTQGIRFRDMLSIPLIATLTGILILVTGLPIPASVKGLLSSLGGATMPMSMLVIGTTLGRVSLLDAFKKPQFAFLSAVRLLLIPIITWIVCRLLTDDPTLLMTCMIIAASPSAVIISVLAIQYGQDGVFCAEGVQHSTICSMLTIPLLIQIFSNIG